MQPVYTFDNIWKTPAAHNLKIQFSLHAKYVQRKYIP